MARLHRRRKRKLTRSATRTSARPRVLHSRTMKLRTPKLDWKGKALKLRSIILSSAPLVEIDREALDMFDFMRRVLRGEISESAIPAMPTMPATALSLLWEPYSDERGETESIYGWSLAATLYCADGKPWWLARAANKLDDPPANSIPRIERVVDQLGADVQRDRIMNCSFGGGNGCAMWWTWINQFPLLEIQVRKNPRDMRVVEEGSPVPAGYERLPRPTPGRGASTN